MKYVTTANPAKAARFFGESWATSAGERYIAAHHPLYGMAHRIEPGEGAPGLVVRVYWRAAGPIEGKVGWLAEKRITRRRKAVKEEYCDE